MTKPVLTVTGSAPANSFSTVATIGVVPLLVAVGDEAVTTESGASVSVIGHNDQARTVVTDNAVLSGFVETPPELDMGFHTGRPRYYRMAKLPENGYEFLRPEDQEYLVGTAFITYFSPDGVELGKEPMTVIFGYNPNPKKTQQIEGVIIR